MFLGLDAVDQTSILKEIVHFRLKLVQGISAIQVERDSNNEATLDLAPPVMLFQLVEMHHAILSIRFSIHIKVN